MIEVRSTRHGTTWELVDLDGDVVTFESSDWRWHLLAHPDGTASLKDAITETWEEYASVEGAIRAVEAEEASQRGALWT